MDYITENLERKGYADIDKKVIELEKFLKLRFDNPIISPPKEIDEIWHIAMLFPKKYNEYCMKTFGDIVDHNPNDEMDDPYMILERRVEFLSAIPYDPFNERVDINAYKKQEEELINKKYEEKMFFKENVLPTLEKDSPDTIKAISIIGTIFNIPCKKNEWTVRTLKHVLSLHEEIKLGGFYEDYVVIHNKKLLENDSIIGLDIEQIYFRFNFRGC